MKKVFAADPGLYRQFGLLPDLPRYQWRREHCSRRPERVIRRSDVFGVRPTRRVEPDGDPSAPR